MDWPALKKLGKKQFDGLSSEVQGYYADVRDQAEGEDSAAVSGLYNFTMHFLTSCCSLLASDTAPLDPELVKSIQHCCHGYSQLCRSATVDSTKMVTGLKTMLYIIAKLNGKVSVQTHMELSGHILDTVKCVSPLETNDQVCDLITKFYSCLWNAAIMFERQGQATLLEVCQLRFSALRILAQRPSAAESCVEKVVIVLNVFEHRSKEKASSSSKGRQLSDGKGRQLSDGKSKDKRCLGQGQTKPAKGRDKERTQAQEKRDDDDGVEKCECVSSQSAELRVFSLAVGLLQELPKPEWVGSSPVLKLCIALYDFLTNFSLLEHTLTLRTTMCNLAQLGNGKKLAVTQALNNFFNLTEIVEQVCTESEMKANLTNLLNKAHTWAKQLSGDGDSSPHLDSIQWLLKQIKARKVTSHFLVSIDNVSLLLAVLTEIQNFLAEGQTDGERDSRRKEEREKQVKTHLDAHRCWLVLYHRALLELHSRKTEANLDEVHSQVAGQLTAYTAAIDSAAWSPDTEMNERFYLGSVCVKLGHLQYNHSRDREAVPFYSLGCTQLSAWCMADPELAASRMKDASLLKMFNCLSQSQHKVGDLDNAMATVTKAFALCCRAPSDVVSSQLISVWVRLKRSAVKEGGDNVEQRLARSFADDPSLDVDTLYQSLQLELSWLLSGRQRPRLWTVEEALLKRIHDTSPTPTDRNLSRLLLMQFDVLTQSHPVFSREEIAEHLERMTSTHSDDSYLHAQVSLLHFCLHVKDKVGSSADDQANKSITLDVPAVGSHTQMMGEEERALVRAALGDLDPAVTVPGNDSIMGESRQLQRRMLRDMLMMVADVLLACREFHLQLEVLAVAKRMSEDDSNNSGHIDIYIGVVDALAGLDVTDIPESLIRVIHGKDGDWREVELGDRGMQSLQLSLVNLYNNTGKIEEVFPLLNQLRDKSVRNELSSLQCGKLHRIVGQCVCTAPPTSGSQDYVVLCALNAYRYHFSLFSRTNDQEVLRPGHQGGEETLWRKLVELLHSTLFLGRTYRHTGDAKRARLYLKEGLALSTKFGLLKWSSMFGMEVAQLLSASESLPSMIEVLKATYTHLCRIEPRTHATQNSTGPVKAAAKVPTPEDLVEECVIALAEERDRLVSEEDKTQTVGGFWQRMVTYPRAKEDTREESDKELVDLVTHVMAWSKSLLKHPASCCCNMCTDSESQLLAFTLTTTAIKVAHARMSVRGHLEEFFTGVVKRFKRMDPSATITQTLVSAGFVGESDVVQCGWWRHVLCVTELAVCLVETCLQRDHTQQALAHTHTALMAARHLPQHATHTVLVTARLTHLKAACLHRLLQSRSPRRSGDFKDAWCWLGETQLAAQVQVRLEKLKISQTAKVSRTYQNDEAASQVKASAARNVGELVGTPVVIRSSASTDRVFGMSSKGTPVNPRSSSSKDRVFGMSSKGTPVDPRSSSSKDRVFGMSSKGTPVDPKSSSTKDRVFGMSSKGTPVDPRSYASGDRIFGMLSTTKSSQLLSAKAGATDRKAKKHSSDKVTDQSSDCEHAKDSKAAVITKGGDFVTPDPKHPEVNQDSGQTDTADSSNSIASATKREKRIKTSTVLTATGRKPGKISKAVSGTVTSIKACGTAPSSKTGASHLTQHSVATKLFSQDLDSGNRGALFQTPLSRPPDTPTSLIKQTLSFSLNFSDSEEEFKPSTPMSTPKLTAAAKQGRSRQKAPESKGCLGLRANVLLKSCRSGKNTKSSKESKSSGPVEALQEKFAYLGISPDAGVSAVPDVCVPEKSRTAQKLSRSTKALSGTTEGKLDLRDSTSVETLQQDLANLRLSHTDSGSLACADAADEKTKESSVSSAKDAKASLTSRGRGKKCVKNADTENAATKTTAGRRRGSVVSDKTCNSVNQGDVEAATDNHVVILSPVVETQPPEADPPLKTRRGRGKLSNSAAPSKPLSTAKSHTNRIVEDEKTQVQEESVPILAPEAGNKTAKRGGRKPRETVENPVKTSQSRRVANTRAAKGRPLRQKSADPTELIPEIETVRGGDEPEETFSHKDVFDFAESDEENDSPPTGRKGQKVKAPAVKKTSAKSAKQTASKTTRTKATEKSKKTAPAKSKLASYAPKPVPLSKKCCAGASDSQLVESVQSDKLTGVQETTQAKGLADLTRGKKNAPSNTLTDFDADHSSIETLRKVLTPQTSLSEASAACTHRGPSKTCNTCRLTTTGPPVSSDLGQAGQAWHMDSLMTYFHNHGQSLEGSSDGLTQADAVNQEEALNQVQSDLQRSMSLIQHFPPVPVLSESCKTLALIKLDGDGDPWEIAALLAESAAVTLRHQFLAHFHRQMRARAPEESGKHKQSVTSHDLGTDFSDLLFPWDMEKYRTVVQSIPQGWTVCQLSVADDPGGLTLMLTHLTCDQEPLTVHLPRFSDEKGQAIYFGFKDILKGSEETVKIHEKSLWWNARVTLDTRLENLIEGMEKHWLGAWKGLLVGQTSDDRYNTDMDIAATKLSKLIHKFLSLRCAARKARQIVEMMQHTRDLPTILSGVLRTDVVSNTAFLEAITSQVLEVMPKVKDADLPVIFILDKHLANFPMEQLSVTRDQPVTRVPSLSLLHHLLTLHGLTPSSSQTSPHTSDNRDSSQERSGDKSGDYHHSSRKKNDSEGSIGGKSCDGGDSEVSVAQRGVDPTSVFYVLNPDGDLTHTQTCLQGPYERNQDWQGVSGVVPTAEQYIQALTQHDLYIYSGHGSGSKYFSREEVLKLCCRAVVLLFGCSSVKVDLYRDLDPDAYFYSYLLAGSPCVLGNLWDVTDRDIDLFCLELLHLWLDHQGTQPRLSLASLVQKARRVVRIRWLNGCSPVVYGLPMCLNRPNK